MAPRNPFGSHATLDTQGGKIALYRLDALSKQGIGHVDRLPVSIKVLLEACCGTATTSRSPSRT